MKSIKSVIKNPKSLDWLDGDIIRPYVFVREENRIKNPGSRFDSDWFPFEPVYFNPLLMDEVTKANQILNLEAKAFEKSGMVMPRWVFYDCAIMPGFVAGFAQKTETLSPEIKKALSGKGDREWTPLSLFIIIPTMAEGEWVAHNLSSVNALLPREHRFYGLGFLTKAFGLWYANIEICCGMTQWQSPAVRLHAHYGSFEVLTAYTPAHSYPRTLTYRCRVDPRYWASLFTQQGLEEFQTKAESAGFDVDPKKDQSLIKFQRKIEAKQGPFLLNSFQIRNQPLSAPLTVYRPVLNA